MAPASLQIGPPYGEGTRTYYTVDGSEPSLVNGFEHVGYGAFGQWIPVNSTTVFKIIVYNPDFTQSVRRDLTVVIVPAVTIRFVGLPFGSSKLPEWPYSTPIQERPVITVASNTVVQLFASDNGPWTFKEWRGLLQSTNRTAELRAVTLGDIEHVHQITSINVQVLGKGRVILDPAPPYEYKDSFQISAVPDPGYFFVGWDTFNRYRSISHQRTAREAAETTMQAQFAPVPVGYYALTLIGEGNITMAAFEKYVFPAGTKVTIGPVIGPDHVFVGWTGDATGKDAKIDVQMDRSKTVVGHTQSIFANRLRLSLSPAGLALLFSPLNADALVLQSSLDLNSWVDQQRFNGNLELGIPSIDGKQKYFRVVSK